MLSGKRKYEDENRKFKAEWEEDFVFVERNGKPMCMICEVILSQLKASNLKRHYDANHGSFSQQFPAGSELRRTKILSLKANLNKQTKVMSNFIKEADVTTEAGFIIAFNIARAKRPYTDGEFIKKNIGQVISALDPENKKLHKLIEQIPASRHTVERRISVISDDVVSTLQNDVMNCSALSLALDESTDIEDKPQLAIFVRYVTNNVDVKEELLDLVALKDTTKGSDIKNALDAALEALSVPIKKLVSVATDGAPAMRGATKGLLGLLNADALYPNFIPVHCIIHREHLVAKYFKFDHIMDVVLKIVNYIRSSAKTHRQFKAFIQELENDELPDDVSWFCLVRWLSVSNVLAKFFNLMEPIKQFVNEKGKFFPELEDTKWLVDMAFFTDIVQHLQSLNLSLQGHNKLISDLAQNVFSLHNKLKLFEKDLVSKTFIHFKCLSKTLQTLPGFDIVVTDYVCKLHILAEDITDRFRDLTALKPAFIFLENPFLVDILKNGSPVLPPIVSDIAAVELELLELQEDEGLKQVKQNSCSTIDFWKQVPEQKYPKTKDCAIRLISIFGTSYSCESLYSTLKFIKNKYRSVLTDQHLNELVRTAITGHQPNFKRLTARMDNIRKASTSTSKSNF
jgi:hypothetical protein